MAKAKRGRVKTPEQQAVRIARSIGVPERQMRGLILVDVSNRSDTDQRHSVRSGETRTVRKLTRIERLHRAGTIERHEAAACQWYADAYSLGYDTIGCTANYAGAGGGGRVSDHLFARYRAQDEARANYAFARIAIPREFLPMFEAVVLEGRAIAEAGTGLYEQLSRSQKLGKLAATFRLTANLLHGHIAHCLPVE